MPSVNTYRVQFPSSVILAHPITSNFKSGLGMYESDRPVFNCGTDNVKKKKICIYVCTECDSFVLSI